MLALLPAQYVGGGFAFVGSAFSLVFLGLIALVVFGPDSDTSVHESNWVRHPALLTIFYAAVAVELVLAAAFAVLALRRAPAAPVRALYCVAAVANTVIFALVLLGSSN